MSTPQQLHKPPSLELLLDYADGILNSATNERIRRYLKHDENTRIILEGINAYYKKHGHNREKLEAYLAGAEESIVQKLHKGAEITLADKNSGLRSIRIAGIAASIFIALLAAYFFFYPHEDANTLVTAYLETPYENLPVNRSDEEATWINPYLQNNFEEAGRILENLIASGNTDVEKYFFASLSQLYQKPPNYQQAITYLENVTKTNNLYRQAARWYLCLAYYKASDVEASQALLKDIARQPDHYKYQEAKKLLETW